MYQSQVLIREDNIYHLNGKPFNFNDESYSMIKIVETEDDKWIVSSWGKKLIYEINNPKIQ